MPHGFMGWKSSWSCHAFTSACLAATLSACAPEPPADIELGTFDYTNADWPSCRADSRSGPSPRSDDEAFDAATKISVRTPANYDSSLQHPLIIVYAPATFNRFASEAHAGLTGIATAAGFIIAYVDSRRLSLNAIRELANIPAAIANRWCVNQSRIYLTGHSDGGTVANAIAFLPDMPFRPRAIAPSAAGVRGEDMHDHACPAPMPVFTLQNADDQLFPNFGRELSDWWAGCNQCSAPPSSIAPGCASYPDCTAAAETLICTYPGGHRQWPDANRRIVDFFERTR